MVLRLRNVPHSHRRHRSFSCPNFKCHACDFPSEANNVRSVYVNDWILCLTLRNCVCLLPFQRAAVGWRVENLRIWWETSFDRLDFSGVTVYKVSGNFELFNIWALFVWVCQHIRGGIRWYRLFIERLLRLKAPNITSKVLTRVNGKNYPLFLSLFFSSE